MNFDYKIKFAIDIARYPVLINKYTKLRIGKRNDGSRIVEITDHHNNMLLVIANERKNRYWDNYLVDLNYSSSKEIIKDLNKIFDKPEYMYLKNKH